MNRTVQALGAVSLAAALASPVAYLVGAIGLGTCKAAMLVATIVWFAVAAGSLVRSETASDR